MLASTSSTIMYVQKEAPCVFTITEVLEEPNNQLEQTPFGGLYFIEFLDKISRRKAEAIIVIDQGVGVLCCMRSSSPCKVDDVGPRDCEVSTNTIVNTAWVHLACSPACKWNERTR